MINLWLKQMGYRQISPAKWAKPYAYTLISIVITLTTIEMCQWFMGADGTLNIWKREIWAITDIKDVGWIQHMEAEVTRQGGYFGAGDCSKLVPPFSFTEQLEYDI